MNARIVIPVSCWLVLACLAGLALAGSEPSPLINYQGILRDADDKPLEGGCDMIFRFYDAPSGGSECLVDEHLASATGDVVMSGGMFNVALGSGNVHDGGGAGVYNDLAEVFRDYAEVYVEVQIYNGAIWETLSPRIRVLSAAYSLNADHLDGNDSSSFLNTSTAQQIKAGALRLEAGGQALYGIRSVGGMGGGYFEDGNNTGYAYVGYGDRGIEGYGIYVGGLFQDTNDTGYGYVGFGNRGIHARGSEAGGYFGDCDGSGYAFVGYGHHGIDGFGNTAGGYFKDANDSGYAFVGYGDYGAWAQGNTAGGYFKDANHSGYAYVGYGNGGVSAHGTTAGGYFTDSDDSGKAYVGYGDRGIDASGDGMGGFFEDTNESGYANVGWGAHGIYAGGNYAGGEFHDSDETGYALVGHAGWGIWAAGGALGSSGMGGEFFDHGPGNWAQVAEGTKKIVGSGSVDFVQNHPELADRVIVYAAPEGDEVATYTRGTARLSEGEARVALGETFKWVTNPDIGLTALITPRGEPIALSVASISTEELVVLGPSDSDVVFDYMVYGLRIGFEEVSVVEEKTIESFIPSMKDHRELYEQYPELQRFNALERFKTMAAKVDGREAVDLSHAAVLKARIQEYDPEVHGPADQLLGHSPPPRESVAKLRTAPDRDEPVSEELAPARTDDRRGESRSPAAVDITAAGVASIGPSEPEPDFPAPVSWNGAWMPASRTVEPGDILALDAERAGFLHRAEQMGDASVVGVAMAFKNGSESDEGTTPSQALVALTGLVECKVDAGYGAVRAGDLLTTSPTPGHAMRALDAFPGTILGKALESLDAGTGSIQVVLMPR